MKYIEVEVLPWRKIVPAIFELFDSTERRQDLMNVLGFASLVVGAPNGGKTYALLTLAANYAAEGYTIVWLNRKGADVEAFRECANYFEADDVAAGWKEVFERLRLRERHEENEAETKQKFLLVFDEYQTHVARIGKEKPAFLQEFMTYIAMSRSLGFKTLIGTQAAYSEDMPKGARDMFANIVMMGNLSKTAKSMYLETDMGELVLDHAFDSEFTDRLFLQRVNCSAANDSSGFISKYFAADAGAKIKTVARVLGNLENTIDYVFKAYRPYLGAVMNSQLVADRYEGIETLNSKGEKILAVLDSELKIAANNAEDK